MADNQKNVAILQLMILHMASHPAGLTVILNDGITTVQFYFTAFE
jgi:hypothetical protein